MIEDWRLIECYQNYFERNVETMNDIMLSKLTIDNNQSNYYKNYNCGL